MDSNSQNDELTHSCFLSLPHKFGTVRDTLKKLVNEVGGNSAYVIEYEHGTLRESIKRAIGTSSILIADLSSAPNRSTKKPIGPRPAVMWEIGYAEALSMGLIFLCQKKHKSNIPAMLRDYQIIQYDLNNIEPMVKEATGALRKLFARERTTESRHFRSTCYVDRKSADLEVRYQNAKETIKILELNLQTVEKQAPMIVRALENNPTLTVQILTLNPFSDFADRRAEQLAQLPLSYRKHLYDKIKGTHEILSKINANRWALQIFDTFPTQIMFQIDESLIHSIISLGRRSRDMLHFEVQKLHPNASDTFEAHFAQLWSASVGYQKWGEHNKDAVQELIGETTPTSQAKEKKPKKKTAKKSNRKVVKKHIAKKRKA